MKVNGNKHQMSKHRGKTFVTSQYLNEEQLKVLHEFLIAAVSNVERVARMASSDCWHAPIVSCDARGVYLSYSHGVPHFSDLIRWNDIGFTREQIYATMKMFADVCMDYDTYPNQNRFNIKINDDKWVEIRAAVSL